MKTQVLVIEDTTYTLNPITVDQAEVVFDTTESQDMRLMTKRLVSASSGIPVEQLGSMPFFIYSQLRDTALEINGLKQQTGEAKATEKTTVN